MSDAAMRNKTLKARLTEASEIRITVTGRKSGRAISIPIWFVLQDETLYLLPVKGSDTQWYKNVVNDPVMRVGAGGVESEIKAVAVRDAAEVSSVVEKFRGKYGKSDVKKYYSKFDVAVIIQMQ
jgi:deazaflavin-dependent oxidoreductase (nitroreductase family)